MEDGLDAADVLRVKGPAHSLLKAPGVQEPDQDGQKDRHNGDS